MDKIKEQDKKKHKLLGAFKTLAVLDIQEEMPETKVSIPSAECVEEAKDWVDHNEK